MNEFTVNRFRTARGKILRDHIAKLAAKLGRPVNVFDVGGRTDYWDNVGLDNIEHITLINYDPSELGRQTLDPNKFSESVGDACDLADFDDQSVDLIHSNSVIEHVGNWSRMQAMASEVQRVGRAGWIQTPAYEFPVEPHFRTLFMHWFGAPTQARMFSLSFEKNKRGMPADMRRSLVDSVNLMSHREMKALFGDKDIYVERLALLKKSYTANWWNT
jgi:predicted SAM-dependent methyltransferase